MPVFSLAGAPLSVSHDATQAVNLLYCRSLSVSSNGEFLKILVFSDRTEKRNLVLVFQSWKITMDHYSYLITLQAF